MHPSCSAANASALPPLSDAQQLKLKQLTVVSMALKEKVGRNTPNLSLSACLCMLWLVFLARSPTFFPSCQACLSTRIEWKLFLCLLLQVVTYDKLQAALEIGSLRELEDFLITQCFYASIIQAKLDQKQRALQASSLLGDDMIIVARFGASPVMT